MPTLPPCFADGSRLGLIGLVVGLVLSGSLAAIAGPAYLIIPQVKVLVPGNGHYQWHTGDSWQLQGPAKEPRLWSAATRLWGAAGGHFTNHSNLDYTLSLGSIQPLHFPSGTNAPEWAANPEGYQFLVTTGGVLIQAGSAEGVFYGLQTLAQLIAARDDGGSYPVVEVQDWPSLAFRGVHWFPSASGEAMDARLIERVFSAFKLNHCVIQCEAARWDRHPEIAMTNSVSQAGLRRLVDDCRDYFIEPVPLINVPGHADWLFRHGENAELAEDPATRYAICVRNPKSIALIEDVMAECIEVFHPHVFHIGHDEITLRGHFPDPNCPYCQGASATELMTESANRLAGWLAERGIRTMMWGDMLLAPSEAADATNARDEAEAHLRRAGVNKNITIADWHYIWNADRRSLAALQADGLPALAATWSEPVNIFRFSQAALAAHAGGLLQTTWDGFFPDERALKHELKQFAAYVVAADYAWSGRSNPPAGLGYDAETVFQRAYAGQRIWSATINTN